MSVMITGGAGFIGYHLAVSLADSGYEVVLADNLQRGRFDSQFERLLSRPNVTFHCVDLTQAGAFDKIGEGVEEVYHLAAINGTENFYQIPDQVLRVNVLVTLNLLEWARHCDVKLLLSSSSETYAGTVQLIGGLVPTDEKIPLCIEDIRNVRWSYGVSKIFAESAFFSYAHVSPIRFSIVRYHNIYGPRMGFDHVMPQFLQRIFSGDVPLRVFGGRETRSFCYVADAVEATRIVMNSSDADGEVVNVGNSSEEIAIQDLATLMLEMCGESTELVLESAPPGSVQRRCPNTEKLRQVGFEAQVPLRQGLKAMIPWYREYLRVREKASQG